MTPEKREALRRLAEKARQTSSGQEWLERILTRWLNGHDEAFIASANPAAVLDLLADADSRESAQKAMGEELAKIDAALDAAGRPAAAFTSERVADLLTQLDDAIFTMKAMERNRDESIKVTTRREYALTKERDALKVEVERLREFAYNFADVAEAAVRHHEWRAAGRQGQEVPFHGAFSNLPFSSVSDLRKFAQAARRVLTQAGGDD